MVGLGKGVGRGKEMSLSGWGNELVGVGKGLFRGGERSWSGWGKGVGRGGGGGRSW